MKSLSLSLVIFLYSFAISAASYNSSFNLEMKLKDGGSSGKVKFTHPSIKGKEVNSGQAVIHNFLNPSALESNNLQAISYVCMNDKVIIFQQKKQSLLGPIRVTSFFSSGRVARNLFPSAFSWLSKLSGMNGNEPTSLACRSDFLDSVKQFRLEELNDLKIGKYKLSIKKSLFRSKISTEITW